MPPPSTPDRRQEGIRKRVSNACYRCRQQKIRCSGRQPCEQCTKRGLPCAFKAKEDHVLVSREYIAHLERRAEQYLPADADEPHHHRVVAHLGIATDSSPSRAPARPSSPTHEEHPPASQVEEPRRQSSEPRAGSDSGRATPSAQIANPFSSHTLRYVADSNGRPWFLGSSSNWAFTRRVLNLAHELLTGQPAPLQDLAFDGEQYDLGWDGQRDSSNYDPVSLPSPDYAMYLVNAVKFHCGQIYHLFDEPTFMQQFYEFHGSTTNQTPPNGLWYVHYLLILAFGKVFVARRREGRRPPGAELFVHAMKIFPDVTFLHTQPLEAVEVLCCKALYLQSLDCRGPAFTVIGQALRLALEQGLYTNMQGQGLDDTHVQRCRNVWWTVYILDRQMASVQGVPLAISDDDITAELPTFSGSVQKAQALELNVKLSKTISQILTMVYGTEGRLSRKFIPSTKSALKSIAAVSGHLKQYFDMPITSSSLGISRLSAHLHVLYHQCIVLATRPLLFSFIKSRLDHPERIPTAIARIGSARTLLKICIDSSQHILLILDKLKRHDLLETFLTWDLEGAFAASLVLLLTPAVDPSLLDNNSHWLGMAHSILDEMILQGNLQAAARKTELEQLHHVFARLQLGSPQAAQRSHPTSEPGLGQATAFEAGPSADSSNEPMYSGTGQDDYSFLDDALWRNGFTADQLNHIADSLDLDGIDWMTTGSYPD